MISCLFFIFILIESINSSKASTLQCSAFFMVQHTWLLEKPQLMTIQTFVGKVMSLLFNTLSRFVIAFLPRSKHLLISWLWTTVWRIDAFELWYWIKLLRVPWRARRSNWSIRKDISPEYSLEGLMLKLKVQYFGHLMWRADSLEKTLMLGKIETGGEGDNREWDG